MIAFIEGIIEEKTPTYLVLNCNGLGYHVNISLNTFEAVQSLTNCKLYTHLNIKEDAHTLYGFATPEERTLFTLLISVSGVGPSTGRMILSSLKPNEVQQAIIDDNVSLIQSVKGIGPKSAKRLILELKEKMTKLGGINASQVSSSSRGTAISALVNLGIGRSAAEKAVTKALETSGANAEVESLIKEALKQI